MKSSWRSIRRAASCAQSGRDGDARTYDYVCTLRAASSIDGMTADCYAASHDFLGAVARRIINVARGINRVVYDTAFKPPGTIEWK